MNIQNNLFTFFNCLKLWISHDFHFQVPSRGFSVNTLVPTVGTYLRVISGLQDDLGGHPERRPYEGVPLAGGVGELPRNTEVSQLHVSILA